LRIRHCDLAARMAPEAVRSAMPSRETEGAGKAGCPKHPQSCAQECTRVTARCAGTPGFPCAMVLTAYAALSPETNSSCLRRRRIGGSHRPVGLPANLRRLDTSNGCQDHTVLPSAASLTRRFDRLMCCRPKFPARAFKRRSSARPVSDHGKTRPANTSRARRCRVHRNLSQRS